MSETTSIPKIYGAMVAIANELTAPKNNTNGFGKYKYRDLPSIRENLKPLLNKHKVFMQSNTDFEIKNGSKVVNNPDRTLSVIEIKQQILIYTADFISIEDGSKVTTSVKVNCDAHAGMSAEQASGSALTYAEKYLLGIVFHIDDDSDAAAPDAQKPPQQNSFTQERVADTRQATTYTAKDLQKGLAEVNACVSEVDLNSKIQGRKNLWGVDAYKNACTAKRAALKTAAAVS